MAYYIHRKDMTLDEALEKGPYRIEYNPAEAHATLKNGIPGHVLGLDLGDAPLVPSSELMVTFHMTDYDRQDWKRREEHRFTDGTYAPVPWEFNDFPDHYAHLSVKSPGLVAYTRDEEAGYNDRQTSVRPGKYLTQFYPALDKADIDRYVAACVIELPKLEFTTDPQMCVDVYVNGPKSCMSRPAHMYKGHVHPAYVYGDSPDIALAFLRSLDNPDKFDARCVVWPEKKVAIRVYPDRHPMMTRLLEVAGYALNYNYAGLNGARLKAIPDDNDQGFILGYVDGIDCAKHVGDYLVLGEGNLNAQATQSNSRDTIAAGVTDPYEEDDETYTCSRCGNDVGIDDWFGGGHDLCQRCNDRNVGCSHCGGSFDTREDVLIELQNGAVICENCEGELTLTCEGEDCDNTWIEGVEFNRAEQRMRRSQALCRNCMDAVINAPVATPEPESTEEPCSPF